MTAKPIHGRFDISIRKIHGPFTRIWWKTHLYKTLHLFFLSEIINFYDFQIFKIFRLKK